jgi:hypothetical protein
MYLRKIARSINMITTTLKKWITVTTRHLAMTVLKYKE